jgi:sulfate permease, SulP family
MIYGPGIVSKVTSRVISIVPVITWLPKYDRTWLRFDLLPGLTLAAFAIPDGMAYASLGPVLKGFLVGTGPRHNHEPEPAAGI